MLPPSSSTPVASSPPPTALTPSGEAVSIPEPKPPTRSGFFGLFSREADDRNQLERDGSQSHNIRRIAAYGAMLMIVVMYSSGLYAIGFFLGLVPSSQLIGADRWHIVVAVLVALFTVPTVLGIAVMRLAATRAEEVPTTVHEWIAKIVDKLTDKISD